MGTRFLTLSLFIVMLSFFIVLNSFSTFEITKTRNLLQSLSETFANRKLQSTFVPDIDGTGGDITRNPLDRLDSILQAQADQDVNVVSNRLRTAMKIRMPVQRFESMMAAAGTEENALLPVLASVFDPAAGPAYRLRVVINTPSNPAEMARRDTRGMLRLSDKSAAFVQLLQEAGLPADSMSAGIGEGPDGTVDLVFQRDALPG